MKRARDLMIDRVETVTPEQTVQDAAQKLRALDLGALPVCQDGKLVGMLTDRDIVLRVLAEGRYPEDTSVGEVMSPNPVCCLESDLSTRACELMALHRIRRLPVAYRNGRLAGLLTLGRIARLEESRVTSGILKSILLNAPYL